MVSRRACLVSLGLIASLTACPGDDSGTTAVGSSSGGPASTGMQTTEGPGTDSSGGTVAATGTTGPDPDSSGTAASTGTGSTTGDSETTAALAPEIDVSIAGMPYASGDLYEFAGPIPPGLSTFPEIEVTIANVGTADLQVTGTSLLTGDATHFTIDTTMTAAVVAPGDSTLLTMAFSPDNGGNKATVLSIDSDDADESPYEINLGGFTPSNFYYDLMPATQPPGRFNHQLVDLQDGTVLTFGGRDATNTWINDTWIYDIAANDWTQVMPTFSPPIRDAYGMAYAGGTTVILYGGNNTFGGGGAMQDTWAFDIATQEWSQLMPSGSPGPRFQHRMVAIGPDQILLYGGRGTGGGEVAETWLYDVAANTWTDLAPPANPGPRSVFALDHDGVNTVTLFGGFENFGPVDNTWSYDVAANTWTQGAPMATPGPRGVLHGGYFENGTFIVHSGKLSSCCVDPTTGTFAYDPAADDWANLAPASEPLARFNYGYAYIEGLDKAILFGGLTQNVGSNTALQETWEFFGTSP